MKKKVFKKPEPVVRVPFIPKFSPSPEQEIIFAHKGETHGIDAGPGSGKSTTIKWEMTINPKDDGKAAVIAFNVSISKAIEPECAPHVEVRRFHEFGRGILAKRFGRLYLPKDGSKHKYLYQQNFPSRDPYEMSNEVKGLAFSFMYDFLKLIDMLRVNLRDWKNPTDVMKTIGQYGLDLDLDQELLDMLDKQMKSGLENPGVIDFTDMIWMPIYLNLDVPKYDTLYVDERQDLNTMMIELLFRMAGGKVYYVGDERQSVYGFGGADPQSTERLISRFGGPQLPLKVCYRCGTDIVKFAQGVYPDGILPFDKNPTGEVKNVKELDLDMPDGSMILSRRNAPLVKHAFTLLRKGRKAIIKGKDIGVGMIKIVDSLKAKNTIDLIDRINIHMEKRIEKLNSKKNVSPAMIENITDECMCLIEIASGSATVAEVKSRIEGLFDEGTPGITLSSCHRAKGLEADEVTIIDFSRIRLSHDKMSDDDRIQEKNLDFVARTRAKKVLNIME